jgi:hypothetical protein
LWLWPNLLSLDAPVIAALWQDIFARDAGVKLTLASRIALPMAVWLIYLMDRLLDTAKNMPQNATARHAFYRSRRSGCYLLTTVAALALCISVWSLPVPVLESGIAVAGTVAVYLLTVHSMRGQWRRWLPKEAAVGLIFGVGTILAPFTWASESRRLLFPALLFGILCWANSAAIEVWEGGRVDRVSAWLVHNMKTVAFATCLSCVPLLYVHTSPNASIALMIAAIGYWAIMESHAELGADALRVAIDVPLLAPLLLIGLQK